MSSRFSKSCTVYEMVATYSGQPVLVLFAKEEIEHPVHTKESIKTKTLRVGGVRKSFSMSAIGTSTLCKLVERERPLIWAFKKTDSTQ
jgi:hypothetical protein